MTKESVITEELRPDWDQYFMAHAELASLRSTCRRKVGAVITLDNHVIVEGYNGAPKGVAHCSEIGGCIRQRDGIISGTRQEYCRAVHAEQNAIIQAGKLGIPIKNGTLYVNTYPCSICARMIINAELKRIVYASDYQDPLAKELLAETDIIVEPLDKTKSIISISFLESDSSKKLVLK